MHLHSIADLDRRGIIKILDRAEKLLRYGVGFPVPLAGKVVGLLFFQTSTRTRIGFYAAAARLGATAVSLGTTRYDGTMSESEDPVDTFQSIFSYFDLVVLRHGDEEEFQRMLAGATVPVINGGCGRRHHPTQTLVDLFEVRIRMGRLDGLRWGIAGDLAGSRAARSLIEALASFDVTELRLMSPPDRRLRVQSQPERGNNLTRLPLRYVDHLDPAGLDVLYMAGFPLRSGSCTAPVSSRERFRLTVDATRALPPGALILNPLPRIDEIERGVDQIEQAAYFEQSRNGLFVRMAVLLHVLTPGRS